MAKKKDLTEKPDNTGLSAFREYNKRLIGKEISDTLTQKSPEFVVSSGSIMIDKLLGTGGFVKGTMVEIAGEQNSGKTTLCLLTARNIQREGGSVAYLNCEQTLDEEYARKLGVDVDDPDKWFYTTENTYEALAPTISALINVGKVHAIIIDSASAVMESAKLSDDNINRNGQIGVAARFWSEFSPKLLRLANDNKTLILITNQIRITSIGPMGATKDTTGGAALKYYKHMSIHMKGKRSSTVESEDDFGNKVYAPKDDFTWVTTMLEKNKCGGANVAAAGRIIPFKGFDNSLALFQLSMKEGLVKNAGAWFIYGDEKDANHFKIQGRENAVEHVIRNPEILKELITKLGLTNAENYFPEIFKRD